LATIFGGNKEDWAEVSNTAWITGRGAQYPCFTDICILPPGAQRKYKGIWVASAKVNGVFFRFIRSEFEDPPSKKGESKKLAELEFSFSPDDKYGVHYNSDVVALLGPSAHFLVGNFGDASVLQFHGDTLSSYLSFSSDGSLYMINLVERYE